MDIDRRTHRAIMPCDARRECDEDYLIRLNTQAQTDFLKRALSTTT